MAGPWEKYAAAPTESGPWSKYAGEPSLVDQIPTGGDNPRMVSAPAVKPAEDSLLARAAGVLEVPAAIGSGAVGAAIGNLAGFAKGLTGGKLGTQEGVREAGDTAHEISSALTYQPRTQTGSNLLRGLGEAINDSGIAGVPLPELAALSRTAAPARAAIADAANAGAARTVDASLSAVNRLPLIGRQQAPGMAGVGAAMTDEALMRTERAANLPVPIKLTKGQANRTFEQQKFERETAKLPEGEPLRQRFADQNQQLLQNFDAWIEDSGMQSPSLRAVGESVTSAIADKRAKVKADVTAAYEAADAAGHMSPTVDITKIADYLEANKAAALNAPVLHSVRRALKNLDATTTGQLSIKDLEEVRKMTSRLAQPGTPNAVYAREIKSLIDAATEGQGGELYRQARAKHMQYAGEFKNQAAVDKLLRLKPGTKDRSVAYEDVFQQSVMGGSFDDLQAIRKTLETAGPKGQQAWKDLQGQTMSHIKEEITKNVARDVRGNPIVSPAALDKLVRNLDGDGKLEAIFGKQGAQQIRDVNDLAKDIYTSPPGSVNHSNTASVLIGLLDTAVSGTSGMPLPIGTALNYGIKRLKTNSLNKQVDAALNPTGKP